MRRASSAAFAGCLGLAAFLVPGTAAAECTGTDATELHFGCNIALGSGDFQVKIYAPSGTVLSSDAGIRAALYRTVVFVHGYGVYGTALPDVAFEDGSSGVFEQLLAEKISVISLAPGNSPDDRVQDDAEAFRAALALIEGYRTDAASPLIVIGHSMGGLVARIGLAEMEAAGEAHDVSLFVTYDSPHSGVNVPHGMQMLKVKLDEWAAMTEEDFIAIDPGWEGVFELGSLSGMSNALDPEAVTGFPDPTSIQAQQMTIQGAVHPEEYPAFMTFLADTGFPDQPHLVAISNGNTEGVGCTQEVAPGGELFWFTGAKGNSVASVRGTFQVFTDNPGAYSFKSDVYYDGLFQNHDGGEKNATTPLGTVLMDHLSGGTLDYAQEMREAAEAAADDFHEPSWRAAENSAIPFVPTSSAFALPVGTADADLAAIVAAGGTPFDDVYAIGDLPAFASNIDHNSLVLPDAILDEIAVVLACDGAPTGDGDSDGVDNACDDDDDNDLAYDGADNCEGLANADQADADGDGLGDACDAPPVDDTGQDTDSSTSPCGCAPLGAPGGIPWGAPMLLALLATARASRSRDPNRRSRRSPTCC